MLFLLSYSVFVLSFPYFFISVPCARLRWPSRQLLSARKYTVSYRIVAEHDQQNNIRRYYFNPFVWIWAKIL